MIFITMNENILNKENLEQKIKEMSERVVEVLKEYHEEDSIPKIITLYNGDPEILTSFKNTLNTFLEEADYNIRVVVGDERSSYSIDVNSFLGTLK